MSWPDPDSNYIVKVSEPAKSDYWTNIIPLISAVLSLASAVLSLSGKFSRWGTVAVWVIALVLIAPRAISWVRSIVFVLKRRNFVKREEKELSDLVRQLRPFILDDGMRSIVYVVRNLCANNFNRIERFRATRFAEFWLQAFERQLEFRTRKFDCFNARCIEFVSIVQQFNHDYVLHAEKAIESGEKVEQSYLRDLEHFREEYNAFLRILETWLTRIEKDRKNIEHRGKSYGMSIPFHFERMNPIQLLAPPASGSIVNLE
jgi:hypothetical protein